VPIVVVTHAPAQAVAVKVSRWIARVTRLAAALAVMTQTVIFSLGLTWAIGNEASVSTVAGRQGGIFAATVLLAGVVFWLTASRPAASPSPSRIGA
jgi:hypothetical protein